MSERGKAPTRGLGEVIRGLEVCVRDGADCSGCPYATEEGFPGMCELNALDGDALFYLKEYAARTAG